MSAFSPLDTLRVIRAVNEDRGLSHAQRSVILQVVLRAGGDTGLAWAGYESIRKATGCAFDTIKAALAYAEGRYLHRHAVGAKGSRQYKVALQPVERSEDACAPASGAPALQPVESCAPASGNKLAPQTSPTTNPKRKRARRKAAAPSGPRRKKGSKAQAKAEALVKLYAEIVKPRRDDHSRRQGEKNAVALLAKHSAEELEAAVRNYAEAITIKGTATQYRKNCGNFFGRDQVFRSYLPAEYVAPEADTAQVEGPPQAATWDPPIVDPTLEQLAVACGKSVAEMAEVYPDLA